MNFKNLQLKTEYRTGVSDVVRDFFEPLLSNAVSYKRAVGFFSSTALVQISKGLAKMVERGGKVQLIVSPHLSQEDIDAIERGYKERDKVIEEALLRGFTAPKDLFEEKRLNLLATLIAEGRLDIKVAFTKGYGMYHEKMGLIQDADNNIVAFSGSINESETAFKHNYEVLDVSYSWGDESDKRRVETKQFAFHTLWTNADHSITVLDFPEVAKEKLKTQLRGQVDYEIDAQEALLIAVSNSKPKNAFRIPDVVNLYEYQQKAIDAWMAADNRGIFDMATGSGKTYTGLGALATLSKSLKDKLGVFIVCPYQHLVEQWVEDIKAFGVEPLICYSDYKDWDKKLKNLLSDFNLGVIERYCVIVSNASFKLPKMKDQIARIKPYENVCLVVDEAHNVGAEGLQKALPTNIKYRLALSATVERHRDEEGTQAIYDYFGKKCITFTLKDAIDNGFLTPYKYYPIVVNLDSEELGRYIELTDKIVKLLRGHKEGQKLSQQAQMLLIKRARIIAGCQSKVEALKECITPYKDKNNILVYCGATRVEAHDTDSGDERQIEAVLKMLGKELNMKVHKFTSGEDNAERSRLKESFSEGTMLQALVAIKCLDEGVNIPGIRTAFILASSTNPKEYIQRRGRVLRKAKGKQFAEIYDFIVMPRGFETSKSYIQDINAELSLVRRELERVEDFMQLAMNASESFMLRDRINEYYKTNYIGGTDYGI